VGGGLPVGGLLVGGLLTGGPDDGGLLTGGTGDGGIVTGGTGAGGFVVTGGVVGGGLLTGGTFVGGVVTGGVVTGKSGVKPIVTLPDACIFLNIPVPVTIVYLMEVAVVGVSWPAWPPAAASGGREAMLRTEILIEPALSESVMNPL
jgi:hypothetical protein